ncbi:hypothetical protein GGS26DRAFT_542562 [Hypomontagnella submonticulosa]|nr:hypothetical protein GGS26DRAFT_542562 [Hypomontagnella submonticulosa]
MNERDMRIRLVVRRDGLPEERLMWNVPLENDPTIAKLLEKVNETIPLEIGQTGLENYVVELQDEDGINFECLHFQPVRTVLKPDDRVFIRALDRDDNRRRRLSGRHQISSDGRRLIDGIPFGRPLLRPPIGRPPVEPPRKRARLAYNSEGTEGDVDDDEDTPMLLLTNGEASEDDEGSTVVKISANFDDADVEDGDSDGEAEFDETSGPDSDEEVVQSNNSESDDSDEDLELSDGEDDLDQELQDLKDDNAQASSATDHDKISALHAAFPSAPIHICETVLSNSNDDLKVAYNTLADGFKPVLSDSAVCKRHAGLKTSQKVDVKKDTASKHKENNAQDDLMGDDDDASESEDEDQVPDFIRQFDRRGLPPGSITSGKGLAQMAAISGSFASSKTNGENESTSATLSGNKASPEKTVDEDDDTSSAATTSDEDEDTEVENDEGSDSDSSSDGSDDDDDNDSSDDGNIDRHSPNEVNDSESDSGSDDQDDNSDGDSDSGPEETSTRPSTVGTSRRVDKESVRDNDLSQDESNSEASSDSDISSSDTSSDDESSEAESSSKSESEKVKEKSSQGMTKSTGQNSGKDVQQIQLPQKPLDIAPPTKTVPPGAGKDTTKRRNARRRAAKLAKKLAEETGVTKPPATVKDGQSSTPALDEKALFEAKRQELLNAIANGGVEVGPSRQFDDSLGTSTVAKRKRGDDGVDKENAQEDTPAQTPASEDVESSSSDQKRRQIDVGAGRRLIFGALGLRNPKTKEDGDKLREKLMENVRPLENPRLADENDESRQTDEEGGAPVEEDLDSWKDKITYRAVECCYEGVELSEPPFPFVQRWDPQQQGSWFEKKNKRGGRSKRAQRNEAHFYQDGRTSKKRKYDESEQWDVGYDDTFNGIEDDTRDADIELNYDEPEDGQYRETNEAANDASQFTDMDDLPSLPSDLTTLPVLHPGEVKIGMVITWQQWSCSSATKWQPQLSNVTGVVTRVDDDATGLEVCLAKRDRYLDRNEKKYDTSTGQRIYDRFEAPDINEDEDEDEGEDEGFRTLGFAEMQQPRIVQQPLPTLTTNVGQSEYTNLFSETDQSTETGLLPTVEVKDAGVDASLEQSGLEEPMKDNTTANTDSGVPPSGQGQQASDMSLSDVSQISSPSRQLHESTSQAISAASQKNSAPEISMSEDVGADGSSEKTRPDGLGSSFPTTRLSSAPLHDSELVTGTPKVVKSKVIAPSPSSSSARSGRQPDYTMDMDVTGPDSLKITDDGISAPLDLEDQGDLGSDNDKSTPTPKPVRQGEAIADQGENTPRKGQELSPVNPSTPSSLSSINTVWCTAMTSRNTQSTQSPSKIVSQSLSQSLTAKASQKARAQKDKEFDEKMRKLDAAYEDQESVSRVPDSFEPNSQMDGLSADISASAIKASSPAPVIKPSPSMRKRPKLSPKPNPKASKPSSSSQFSIPPGTQVIELSSDSEPAYTEDYADDDIDGTYSPATDSFPRGNGWVHKEKAKGKGVAAKGRNARSVTAPLGRPQAAGAGAGAKRSGGLPSSSSQGRYSLSLSSSAPISIPAKARRKTSSKF